MKTILVLLCLTLTACQYVPPRDIDSPFFYPPVGSQLRLTQPLTIPPNDAGVYIQYGRAQYSYWQLNTYQPNCDFEVRTRAIHEQVIEPDTFTVVRTVRETETVMLAPVTVASIDAGGTPAHENYMTVLYLHSDKQPDVFRMTCQHWDDSALGEHLTVKHIRQALGEMFVLTLAGGEP